MTTVEVPYSIAAALPSLSVMDITNDVSREVAESGVSSGIVYIHTESTLSLVRVQERETGFFEDLESLLERVVPSKLRSRERLVAFLLGPRSEHIPFADGTLCLGQWQRILLFSLDAQHRPEWTLTVVG
jgi:secondary thiamine-phosphate synthase enzyme